jgi:HEAT repeat protein
MNGKRFGCPGLLTGELATVLKERAVDPNARARAAAFWAIGKTGDASLAPFFQDASRMKAHPVVKQAADWALNQIN